MDLQVATKDARAYAIDDAETISQVAYKDRRMDVQAATKDAPAYVIDHVGKSQSD